MKDADRKPDKDRVRVRVRVRIDVRIRTRIKVKAKTGIMGKVKMKVRGKDEESRMDRRGGFDRAATRGTRAVNAAHPCRDRQDLRLLLYV